MADKYNLQTARDFASQASRGGLSALGNILRSLSEGKVHDSPVPGSGITAGAGAIAKTSVHRDGDVIKTSVLIDLTGLESEATLDDIIGDNGAANCWLARIVTSVNGTILGGTMTCLEAPAGGEVDIDLNSAVESTGVEGALISALTETVLLATTADWTIDLARALTDIPADGEYLYLSVGTVTSPTAGTYTAGKFLIELFGYDA